MNNTLIFCSTKETPWCFECFQQFLSVFLAFLLGLRGIKILGVLCGFPWFLPKHQGMEDQGSKALPAIRTVFDLALRIMRLTIRIAVNREPRFKTSKLGTAEGADCFLQHVGRDLAQPCQLRPASALSFWHCWVQPRLSWSYKSTIKTSEEPQSHPSQTSPFGP